MNNKNKNNSKFSISISYTTNFKPADFLFFNDIKIFKKNKTKIISRNFFLFLLLLKYSNSQAINTSIFVKPSYNKFITLLRAPYRYKLSRHQFLVSRYSVLMSISTDINKIYFNNTEDLIFFIKLIKNFYVWFESNIVYQHQVRFFFNFFYKNQFCII